jgi:glycosyltransferase involved in cell wall biosynthesis
MQRKFVILVFYRNFAKDISSYMRKKDLFPDYIFESSWEVCNKVGGIYTVLSTRAKTLQKKVNDHIIFIGPDCWEREDCPYFREDVMLFAPWVKAAKSEGLKIKVGRWQIPGFPIAILVDYSAYYAQKNEIYSRLWELYRVDSLHAYGDYDEASMFSYGAAKVVESFYHFYLSDKQKVLYQGNEWMTGLGLLYIHYKLPQIATIFTTHATSVGRSIAGNNKPLYGYLDAYQGDQMAEELNMQSKHSIEKQTALNVNCFTTVSDITARECKSLLDKPVDAVLPNGFENDFVPKGSVFTRKRSVARKRLMKIANALTGKTFDENTLLVSTSGRYEFRNKGIDVYIEALNRLSHNNDLQKDILAFIDVPGWVENVREDLKERLKFDKIYSTGLDHPYLTHWLHHIEDDNVSKMMSYLNMYNAPDSRVTLIFIPCYLTGDDGIVDLTYYDTILGNDLCVYPSYYEPWGYTPLESIAFNVPCITTDLAGFGLWVNQNLGHDGEIGDGVKVIHRTDDNYSDVADAVMTTILEYSKMTGEKVKEARLHADLLSKKALWSHFIKYYYNAYDFALSKADIKID